MEGAGRVDRRPTGAASDRTLEGVCRAWRSMPNALDAADLWRALERLFWLTSRPGSVPRKGHHGASSQTPRRYRCPTNGANVESGDGGEDEGLREA